MLDFLFFCTPESIKAGEGTPIVVHYPVKHEFVPHCSCEPKLYHWSDSSNMFVHGYFLGCKKHCLITLHKHYKDIELLRKDWDNNKCIKDNNYFDLEYTTEVNK
jgi:hypothetical protein|nr:MAG TPA: hypothetical protein [Caudoviricetes sp.]